MFCFFSGIYTYYSTTFSHILWSQTQDPPRRSQNLMWRANNFQLHSISKYPVYFLLAHTLKGKLKMLSSCQSGKENLSISPFLR